jgi:hypothetical protein
LAQSAENRWNKLRGFKLLADVIEGVKFVDGENVKGFISIISCFSHPYIMQGFLYLWLNGFR